MKDRISPIKMKTNKQKKHKQLSFPDLFEYFLTSKLDDTFRNLWQKIKVGNSQQSLNWKSGKKLSKLKPASFRRKHSF